LANASIIETTVPCRGRSDWFLKRLVFEDLMLPAPYRRGDSDALQRKNMLTKEICCGIINARAVEIIKARGVRNEVINA
jgi:hypothetical protein